MLKSAKAQRASNLTLRRPTGSRCSPLAAERRVIRTRDRTGNGRPGDRVMDRRRFLAALAAGVVAAPSGVGADERLRRVGWLDLGTAANTQPREVLPARLRERGWIEGKNIAFDWLYADARPERLSPLVAELLRR